MSSEHYTKSFYERLRTGAARSAEVIAPLVLQLLSVRSVADVGCGDGTWLAAFQKLGVSDFLGVDGDYLQQELLQIPAAHFRPVDLTKPFDLGRPFDLAICLEVAEHLPLQSAPSFVASLTATAPAILFSAAIPYQGGENHINEQWPDQWVAWFAKHGYIPIDAIRKRVWQNDAVEFWYAQNTLLFVRPALLERAPALQAELDRTDPRLFSLVHPRQYIYLESRLREALARDPAPSGVLAASRHLAACLKSALRRRLRGHS